MFAPTLEKERVDETELSFSAPSSAMSRLEELAFKCFLKAAAAEAFQASFAQLFGDRAALVGRDVVAMLPDLKGPMDLTPAPAIALEHLYKERFAKTRRRCARHHREAYLDLEQAARNCFEASPRTRSRSV